MSTSLKSRVIYREHSTSNATWAGTYKLLVKATKIPSPIQAPNPVESTTLEDPTQTFEMGINASGAMDVEGNLDRTSMSGLEAMSGKQLDIINLYGTDGVGGVGKWAYTGQVSPRPSDVDGNDTILGMVATIVPNSVPEDIFEGYTVSAAETDGELTFTVTAKAG